MTLPVQDIAADGYLLFMWAHISRTWKSPDTGDPALEIPVRPPLRLGEGERNYLAGSGAWGTGPEQARVPSWGDKGKTDPRVPVSPQHNLTRALRTRRHKRNQRGKPATDRRTCAGGYGRTACQTRPQLAHRL